MHFDTMLSSTASMPHTAEDGLMIFRSDTADPLQYGSSYDVNTMTVQNGWTN